MTKYKHLVELWDSFLDNDDNLGHYNRKNIGISTHEKIIDSLRLSEISAERIKREVKNESPQNILEVGCSTGVNCIALAKLFPSAKIYGIEPEIGAINVAQELAKTEDLQDRITFTVGVGEHLPYINNKFDLIVCHTVIEHVASVAQVVSEMTRVLGSDGEIHLEAPNYLFPYETHLKIWTIPLFGKRFVKFTAILQGKYKSIDFLDHLQFVTPMNLEREFKFNNLNYHDRALDKIESLILCPRQANRFKFFQKLISIFNKIGLASLLIYGAKKTKMYSSVMYTLSHK